jgi:hypothetical protein
MLDEIQAVSLLLLIIGHGFLIRGCFNIHNELPVQGGLISEALGNTTNMIDELADLLNELMESFGQSTPSAPAGPVDLPSLLSMFLMNKTGIGAEHASQTEREIYEVDPTQNTTKAEDQFD